MIIANDLLDLRVGIGQVAAKFRWELLDPNWNVIGELHPETGASMSNQTNAQVMRSVRSFKLSRSDWSSVNLFRDRVRPSMVLQDGTVWPMGVLYFTSDDDNESTADVVLETTLLDARMILSSPIPYSFGVSKGASIRDGMVNLINLLGFTHYSVAPDTSVAAGGPLNWPPDASALDILKSLAGKANFHSPYFDNQGSLTLRPIDPLQAGVGHQYTTDINGRIEVDTYVRSSNLLSAPNAFKVISTDALGHEVFGIAYVDPSLPHSKENRGFISMSVTQAQSLGSTAACVAMAQTQARQSATQYRTGKFSSVPDPRHDTFDIVQVRDEVYREVGWTMEMASGGRHEHTLVGRVSTLDE